MVLFYESNILIYTFGWFYGESILIDYLLPNPFYTYVLDICDLCMNSM